MIEDDKQRERLSRRLGLTKPITCLDGLRFVGCSSTSLTLRTRIQSSALNVRGFAHGGWIFSLCDTASGAFVFSRGFDCVTQQASINYLHGAVAGEDITARVRNLHMGRTTIVNEVTLTNQDGVSIAVCTLTMYVMGRIPE